MKVLAFILIILCHNQNVSCQPIFEFMVAALTEMASTLTNSLKVLKNKFKSYFTRDPMQTTFQINKADENKNKKTLSDLVEKIPLKSENLEPPTHLTTPQMVTRHGRTVQSHIILTKDGYLLTIHRIPPISEARNSSNSTNRTVILHHGLLGSSADWILLGPKKSLPYILSDASYDVWMVNARGNCYSRSHFSLKVDSTEFWKFSWQEMGEYDLPAVIDYIRRLKNSTELIDYIGHSMGATALLVLLSTKVQYNQYLRIGILLAPLAFMTNIEGPLKYLATVAFAPPQEVMDIIGIDEFIASKKIPDALIANNCEGPKIFCSNPLFFIGGGIPEDGKWEADFVESVLYHVPAGGSTNTMLHYAQLASNKKFHKFYNTSSEFPLSQITLPLVVLSSAGDRLATIPDILNLYFSIGRPLHHYVVRERNLSHTDFVWGVDADVLVFSKVMDFLDNGLQSPYKANMVNGTL